MLNYRANSPWAQCIADALSTRNVRRSYYLLGPSSLAGGFRDVCLSFCEAGAAEDVGLRDLWTDPLPPAAGRAGRGHVVGGLGFARRLVAFALLVREPRALLWSSMYSQWRRK
jgi:hypothetical protein